MKLLIDGRALQSPIRSGIPRVTETLLARIGAEGRLGDRSVAAADCCVFTTGWRTPKLTLPAGMQHYHLHIPNKLLALALFLVKWPKLDRLVAHQSGFVADEIFVPNLHFFAAQAPYTLLIHDLAFLVAPHLLPWRERLIHTMKRPLTLIRGANKLLAVSNTTARDTHALTGRAAKVILPIEAPIRHPERSEGSKKTSPIVRSASGHERCAQNYSEAPFLLMLGTVEPRKNHEAAIAAFLAWKQGRTPRHQSQKNDASSSADNEASHNESRLCKNGFRLVIAGTHTKYGEVLRRTYAAHQDVEWLGPISDAEKDTLLREAACLLYPSWYEGFGIPIVEALRAGTPVITSAVTSMPEVVRAYQGKTPVVLVDPARPETIVAALSGLLT